MSEQATRVRLALATSREHPGLAPDDRLLLTPLRIRGVLGEPVVWDDPAADWSTYAAVVVRSCWDYHHHLERFEAWTRLLESAGVPTWNPPAMLRWNARKTYLQDLAALGIPTVPTRFVEQGESVELEALLEEAGWRDAVVKPVVSASAHETWRTSPGRIEDGKHFRRLTERGAVMVQPYLREIERDGEWSLCFFGGRYSHAVLKRPAPGDFRVQSDHGGVYLAREPGRQLVTAAERVLDAAGSATLYARVDGCVLEGTLHLMELELIEPGLFLAMEPSAPARFVESIAGLLASAA